MKKETSDYLSEHYGHLTNADGFHVYCRADEGDVGHREMYIVIPERGVSISISNHDQNGGVFVSANQGIHDPWIQSYDQVNLLMSIPDGEQL